MPRPAMNRISVATMGWMPNRDTSHPLNSPSSPATPIAATIARVTASAVLPTGTTCPRKIIGASTPEIAISDPTDRSIPPVAITRFMPTATMMIVHT